MTGKPFVCAVGLEMTLFGKAFWLVMTMVVFIGLSGCAETTTVPDAWTTPEPKQPGPPTQASGPEINATSSVLHNISVKVAFTAPGVHGPGGGVDPPTCPPGPPRCRVGVHERINMANADVFNGTMVDHAWLYPDSVDERTVAGIMTFTGTIVGCSGSGTATMPWIGTLDPSPVAPNLNGDVIHQHDFVSTPTKTAGFARIAEVFLDLDAYLSPVGGGGHGIITGYILCT
ncbi:MAG: hypothetical protein HYT80_03260 [Euryarchaeota archaeon]|nr:hypothetical protein [Euryarchaeota archaeon]